MHNKKFLNKIILGDAREILPKIADDSIDLILTDPPYFLDKLDNNWNVKKVSASPTYSQVVKSLPPGMKFDKKQGEKLYEWFLEIARELHRILKPGGFFFSFSSPRLYHRIVCAIEDAGFLIRDCFIWLYNQNQAKAMSLDHFIERLDKDESFKRQLKAKLAGWKTPQVKSCFEPIVMAQKKCEGTFLENMLKYQVGLINTNVKIGEYQDMFPANIMTVNKIEKRLDRYFLISKPSKEEKGEFNFHKTVKPLAICEYIIMLTTFSEEAIVLDPFVGSGTTAVAAKKLGRKYIGIEINPEYVEIARKRIKNTEKLPPSSKQIKKQPYLFNSVRSFKR